MDTTVTTRATAISIERYNVPSLKPPALIWFIVLIWGCILGLGEEIADVSRVGDFLGQQHDSVWTV